MLSSTHIWSRSSVCHWSWLVFCPRGQRHNSFACLVPHFALTSWDLYILKKTRWTRARFTDTKDLISYSFKSKVWVSCGENPHSVSHFIFIPVAGKRFEFEMYIKQRMFQSSYPGSILDFTVWEISQYSHYCIAEISSLKFHASILESSSLSHFLLVLV